jgi:hypothetical protein
MEKLKELWHNWRGTIGFVGGALVVSTTFFTCTVEPNEEAIKEAVLPAAPVAEAKEEAKPVEVELKEEPKKEEEPVEVPPELVVQ